MDHNADDVGSDAAQYSSEIDNDVEAWIVKRYSWQPEQNVLKMPPSFREHANPRLNDPQA